MWLVLVTVVLGLRPKQRHSATARPDLQAGAAAPVVPLLDLKAIPPGGVWQLRSGGPPSFSCGRQGWGRPVRTSLSPRQAELERRCGGALLLHPSPRHLPHHFTRQLLISCCPGLYL